MAEERDFGAELDLLEGKTTPVGCVFCSRLFAFRTCHLFLWDLDKDGEDEHVFVCEGCFEKKFGEPLRERIITEGLLEKAEEKMRDAARSAEDPEERREALEAYIRAQLLKRGRHPDKPESN